MDAPQLYQKLLLDNNLVAVACISNVDRTESGGAILSTGIQVSYAQPKEEETKEAPKEETTTIGELPTKEEVKEHLEKKATKKIQTT